MWHMTLDTCNMNGGEHCVKISGPSSNGLGFMVLWIFGGKGWLNQSVI